MIENSLSRRSFLAGAGIVTGAAVVAAGTGLIAPKSAEAAPQAFPWPYPTLLFSASEITAIKQAGYGYYFTAGGCMAATGKALVEALKTKEGAGGKWETFPADLFKYGGGGVNSWGLICGSLHGATWVIRALFATSGAPNTACGQVIDDLYQWYCGFNFPSLDHEGYAAYTGQTRTICNSPLCHASVSTWCTTAGKKVSSNDKKDRCAKLSGDVAGKTIELLNSYFDDSAYTTTFVQPDASCSGCHVTGGTEKWVQGKAGCTTTCHAPGKNTEKPAGSTCTRT